MNLWEVEYEYHSAGYNKDDRGRGTKRMATNATSLEHLAEEIARPISPHGTARVDIIKASFIGEVEVDYDAP